MTMMPSIAQYVGKKLAAFPFSAQMNVSRNMENAHAVGRHLVVIAFVLIAARNNSERRNEMLFITVKTEDETEHILGEGNVIGCVTFRNDRYARLPEKLVVARYLLLLALLKLGETNKLLAMRVARNALNLSLPEARDFINDLMQLGFCEDDDTTAYLNCPDCAKVLEAYRADK